MRRNSGTGVFWCRSAERFSCSRSHARLLSTWAAACCCAIVTSLAGAALSAAQLPATYNAESVSARAKLFNLFMALPLMLLITVTLPLSHQETQEENRSEAHSQRIKQ